MMNFAAPSGLETAAASYPCVSVMPPMLSALESDSDAHLSDLDDEIKEYIATRKAVHICRIQCSFLKSNDL